MSRQQIIEPIKKSFEQIAKAVATYNPKKEVRIAKHQKSSETKKRTKN